MKKISLKKIIQSKSFEEMDSSTSFEDLKIFLSDQSLSLYRLGKKSKVYVVNYMNVTFFFEYKLLTHIQIDFEYEKFNAETNVLVFDDFFSYMKAKDIEILLKENAWRTEVVLNTIAFIKENLKLEFNSLFELHLLTITL